LRSLGDIASGVGMDKLPNLILAFGQVRAATKLTGMELRQFTEAGVPLLEELSNVMGQPVSAIQDMISEGEVGFPIVQQALQNLTGEGGRFNDLMEKQAQSLGGMWSNLQDAWEQFLREQGAQLIEWSKQFVGFLSDLVQNHLPVWIEKTREIVQWLDQNKVVLAAVVGIIAGALVPAVLAAVAAFVSMAVALAPFAIAGGALFMFIQGLREGNIVLTAVAAGIMTLFIPTLASLAATIFTTVIPAAISMAIAFAPFLIAGAVVAGLVAGIMLIIKHWDLLKAKATEIWNAIKNVIESVVESITDKIQKLISVINSVRSAISSIGSFVGKAASSVAGYVNPNANYFGPAAPRAGGGPVQAGQPYMVGERGPELFMPSSSGSIVPNNRMGGITVNINNPSVRNDGDIVAMKRMINEVFRDLAVNYKLTHS
jgi:tape measure domain-containing protein